MLTTLVCAQAPPAAQDPVITNAAALIQDGRTLAVSVDARRLQVWDLVELRRQFRELGVDWEVSP